MSDDKTNNFNKKDGENNGQGARDSQDDQGHGDNEINLEMIHDPIEFYLKRLQNKMTDAI